MKEATTRFIKFRPRAKYIEDVEHRPNTNYKQRECISMSVEEAKNFGTDFVSGWLIDNYNEDINATPIIHHCWNIDKDGKHYDTIPVIDKRYEYVSDPDVNKPYRLGESIGKYISPVFYLTDSKLKIIIRDGKKLTITKEQHTNFLKECKGV